MFKDAITPLDWLWEPEVKDEIDRQIQAIVRGDTTGQAAGDSRSGSGRNSCGRQGRSYFPVGSEQALAG